MGTEGRWCGDLGVGRPVGRRQRRVHCRPPKEHEKRAKEACKQEFFFRVEQSEHQRWLGPRECWAAQGANL